MVLYVVVLIVIRMISKAEIFLRAGKNTLFCKLRVLLKKHSIM